MPQLKLKFLLWHWCFRGTQINSLEGRITDTLKRDIFKKGLHYRNIPHITKSILGEIIICHCCSLYYSFKIFSAHSTKSVFISLECILVERVSSLPHSCQTNSCDFRLMAYEWKGHMSHPSRSVKRWGVFVPLFFLWWKISVHTSDKGCSFNVRLNKISHRVEPKLANKGFGKWVRNESLLL